MEVIKNKKDLTNFKRKFTMARNAGVDAFKFKDRTYLLSVAKLKIEIASERIK